MKEKQNASVLQFENVSRQYNGQSDGQSSVVAVNEVSFTLQKGDFTALVGPSGSGKTTLLNLASGLDLPTSGEIWISGNKLSQMSQKDLCNFRRQHIGFIFQAYNLFPVLNAVENVEFTSLIRGDSATLARKRAIECLTLVGLGDKLLSTPAQLSGGQQQRVAVARALATEPEIIFADEPTANLDSKNAMQLIELFEMINRELGATFFFSTHDQRLVERVHQCIEMSDGEIKGKPNSNTNANPSHNSGSGASETGKPPTKTPPKYH